MKFNYDPEHKYTQEELGAFVEAEKAARKPVPPERRILRAIVRGGYDMQKLRIQTGNRIVANFKSKILGQKPGMSEAELEEWSQAVLTDLRGRFRLITEGIVKGRVRARTIPTPETFKGDELVSTFAEFVLVKQYVDLYEAEKQHFQAVADELEQHSFYTAWLRGVKGMGPAMAAVILSEINILEAHQPSKMVAYAGIDVGPDGLGRTKNKEHLVKRPYFNARSETWELKDSITFNPFLKTKLLGVLAVNILRAGREGNQFAEIYYNYKNRMENHAKWGIHNDGKKNPETGRFITSKGRRHQQAMRYMAKHFLLKLYDAWRKHENLPVTLPYEQDKLGRAPHGEPKHGV